MKPRSQPFSPDERSAKVLFTGASSGLGSDVLRRIRDLIEAHPESESFVFLTAGRHNDDNYFFDLGDSDVPSFADLRSIVHFAWDRTDLSSNSKNISGLINLLTASTGCDANFVFVSSIEAESGTSIYAKQKRICEGLVSEHGGVVLRLGAVIGGDHDFFARLKRLLRAGPLGVQVHPDPRMKVTSIESLVGAIFEQLTRAEPGHVEDLTNAETQSLSSLLELEQCRIRLSVPYRLAESTLRLAGFLIPSFRVWHDRILALAPR